MRQTKRNFNRTSNLFPLLWNNLFADDNNVKHSLERQKAHREAIKRWFNQSNVAANIKNLEEAFAIELAVPGYKKEDFKVEFEKGNLTISAKKEEREEDTTTEDNFTHKEFTYSNFERSFNLPEDGVDVEGIKATYEAGILTVKVPKRETEDNKRHINVQ
ncbi:MAG: Hsp20/alpha crystallin family protein [Aureispira sp.]